MTPSHPKGKGLAWAEPRSLTLSEMFGVAGIFGLHDGVNCPDYWGYHWLLPVAIIASCMQITPKKSEDYYALTLLVQWSHADQRHSLTTCLAACLYKIFPASVARFNAPSQVRPAGKKKKACLIPSYSTWAKSEITYPEQGFLQDFLHSSVNDNTSVLRQHI